MKLKDIAERAGVSTATVSNVINGNHHKVSQATIEKVQKIIEQLEYKPSATARSLASKESRIIGVVIPYLGEDQSFSINPYTSQVIGALENYVRRQGYYLMIRSVRECKEIVPIFSSWNVDGVVILGAGAAEVPEMESRLKVPTVYLDTYAQSLGIANVGVDDYKGGYLAARYLLEKGHRRIALASPDFTAGVMKERYRGFCDAMKERGAAFNKAHFFEVANTSADGAEAGKKIAMSGHDLTAVAVMSDIIAVGVMDGLRKCGMNVPEDISVIGFDNLMACQYSHPGLTTVSQNIEGKVTTACQYLFEMIRNKEKMAVNEILDVEIVERESVKDLNIRAI